ncbi:MAG: aminotransferase class I/II-fold pyridoxal phosphate-dependent enzyme [Mucilaginibacter sp.]
MAFQKASFSSENFACVQQDIMQALIDTNTGHVASYGNDEYTAATIELLKVHFGDYIDVYFTFNGTGANNFGLACVTERHHAIFCADKSHLFVDESTAPETFIACRLYPVESVNGKINVDSLESKIRRCGDIHHPQGKIVSLTQPTEYGTVYTLGELKAIKAVCTKNNLLLHIDGARFFNAAVHLNKSLKEMSSLAGVDILTLGGTKLGMMFGEAVIFFNPASSVPYKFTLKRSMQLASKNRFIAVQFQRLFLNDLWQKVATHTNRLAKLFEKQVQDIPLVKIAYPVETNAVFLKMPKSLYLKMQRYADFYYWDEQSEVARFVFSFSNTVEEVMEFSKYLREGAASILIEAAGEVKI